MDNFWATALPEHSEVTQAFMAVMAFPASIVWAVMELTAWAGYMVVMEHMTSVDYMADWVCRVIWASPAPAIYMALVMAAPSAALGDRLAASAA